MFSIIHKAESVGASSLCQSKWGVGVGRGGGRDKNEERAEELNAHETRARKKGRSLTQRIKLQPVGIGWDCQATPASRS